VARSALPPHPGHQERATEMGISNDPLTIEFDKVVELIHGLGLDPADPKDIRRITIDGEGVEVIRYRRDNDGKLFIGFGDQAITETVTIRFTR
jgi:hypothetical protein